MKDYSTVFFDLDGTLIDSGEGVFNSVEYALKKFGIEVEDKNQFVEECVNEFPERFTAEDYVDSFDWITITLCCANCNESVDWIDLELS